jgi:hypothetical protein
MNRFKCEVQHGKVFPCDTLDKTTDNTHTRSEKGIFALLVPDLVLDKWISKGFWVKTDYYTKGIMFNFCPFCGTDIGSHLKIKAKEVLGDD